jgi:signal transduction histidine kinase
VRPRIRRWSRAWLTSIALVAAITVLLALLEDHARPSSLAVLYLLAVLPVAAYWGVLFGAATAVLSVAVLDFLFMAPRYTFLPADSRNWIELGVFLVMAVLVGHFTARARQRALASARLAQEQAALHRVATLVARAAPPAEIFETVTREVGLLCDADLARMERYEGDDAVVGMAAWTRDHDRRLALGTRLALTGVSIAARVRQTGGSVRVDSFVDASGPIAEEAHRLGIRSSVGCPIRVGGCVWGVIAASSKRETPFPRDTEARIGAFTELVATAVSNAVSRGELAASRARIVTSADEVRRQIERNLHDGIQQRLVTLGLQLQGMRDGLQRDRPELLAELSAVEDGLRAVIEELREISRGIHPVVLSEGGLVPALKSLARRSGVPVELSLSPVQRLPHAVEAAAYYAVSEALTNATKHANASVAHVDVALRNSTLEVSIRDDGVGGADPARGTGIVGLGDRVEALGGTIAVASPPGAGTSITLRLPIGPADRPVEVGPRTDLRI